CFQFVSELRWENGPQCPHCGSTNVCKLSTRPDMRCRVKGCRKSFSIKVGTIFEDSPLPLTKWLPALWIIVNSKTGVSSSEIARSLGVTQSTGWFMMHRIREALRNELVYKLSGEVEIDQAYVGGKAKNKHRTHSPFRRRMSTRETMTAIVGILQRRGEVRAKVIGDLRNSTIVPEIYRNVEDGARVYTDGRCSHYWLKSKYEHETVLHKKEYSRGKIHINTIENFWSHFKRTLGTYIQIGPTHVERYLDEQAFRHNHRNESDAERFVTAVSQIFGRRLTYAKLTGKTRRNMRSSSAHDDEELHVGR
ncbi:MAG: IS1595 family transposase, partial [Bacteroidota bacterium]|nr:IS1595 family transposase [Bacteroidota bacterium]